MLRPNIRKYEPGDELAIGRIYYDAVHQLTRDDYTEEQRNAWATPIEGGDAWAEKWRRRCDGEATPLEYRKQPWVAVVDGDVAGFIEFDADGHIDCTYVSPKYAGKGYMSAIMERIFQEARRSNLFRLYDEVSITARSFFECHGFRVVRDNPHEVRSVPILNYIMECWLHPDVG
ncbi:MAG: GNAT family N-acetyltransferase [Cyanobacteria bacterium J06656_5]